MRSVVVRVAESGWQTTTLLVETHARKHTRTHRGKLAEKRLGLVVEGYSHTPLHLLADHIGTVGSQHTTIRSSILESILRYCLIDIAFFCSLSHRQWIS